MDTAPEWQLALVFVVRWYLGICFLTSALGKLTDLTSFVQGTLDYRVLPGSVAKMFALALPWLELGLTALLLTGIALPVAGWVLAGLLGCFIVAVTMNLRRGRAIACNCHGIAGTRTIS
ncbi:MAG: DoxX family membrane protein [Chloroflexi bacterium AL-W]|nr:DoxX family membrane protein [Chloroflexi bacterium AL-N1]NOK65173.1 DoxX family membrane protein [Chloroflexi bacterium AL-N10]NOK72561.1 DoxX family membrane protein [Chloroflexi bacterium AL-N5]NOK79352.1 DoxX family membrane protein [Chloroflexi bacterium AL-W]NOK87268.1 DoxX family membrane protein [Chloroflexi bacterium AL-N15]